MGGTMAMAESRSEQALREIARIASEAAGGSRSTPDGVGGAAFDDAAGCRIMPLPARLQQKAAELAAQTNPVNAPLLELLGAGNGDPLEPLALTLVTAKYWGP